MTENQLKIRNFWFFAMILCTASFISFVGGVPKALTWTVCAVTYLMVLVRVEPPDQKFRNAMVWMLIMLVFTILFDSTVGFIAAAIYNICVLWKNRKA